MGKGERFDFRARLGKKRFGGGNLANEALRWSPVGQGRRRKGALRAGEVAKGGALRSSKAGGPGPGLALPTGGRSASGRWPREALHFLGSTIRGSASVQGWEERDSFIPSAALRAEEALRSGCAVGLICGRLLLKRLGLKPKKGKRFGGGNLADEAPARLRPAGAAVPPATKKPGRTPAMAKKREF